MDRIFSAPVAAIVAAVAWMVALGAAGIVATDLSPWYYALRKPSWKPSDVWFGPVWSTIFLLAAIALVLAWTSPQAGEGTRTRLLAVYVVNGVLNVTWSLLFFRQQRPDWALVEVGALWLSIVAMIWVLAPLSAAAAWLVAPYLAWVTFASVLNRAIVRLNGPFGGG